MDKHSIAAYLRHIGASLPNEGSGWRKMKCPFHTDKHASAGINYEDERFKCHGCGVGGDVYDLIMHREGGNYREAVKFAEAISPTGNDRIRPAHTSSRRLSSNTESIGRRSKNVPLGGSPQSIARTRRLQG